MSESATPGSSNPPVDGLGSNDLARASPAAASPVLASWPIAVQCARDKLRASPVLVFALLLCLISLGAGSYPSSSSLFGGVTDFTSGFLEPRRGFVEMLLFGLTLALGLGLISEEQESGHLQLVLLRPVSRAAVFGGRTLGAAFLIGAGMRMGGGTFTWPGLLALPLALLWTFAWLSSLAALSVVVSGMPSVFFVLGAGVCWLGLRVVEASATVYTQMRAKGQSLPEPGWFIQLGLTLKPLTPYFGPQDPSELIRQLEQHAHLDFGPLLFDLLWISAMWALGAFLLSRRELARRR